MLSTLNAAIPEWLKRSPAFVEAVAQAETDIEARRATALDGLAEVEAEWAEKIPPLEQVQADAIENVRKAHEAVQAAQRKQLAATAELNGARYQLDRRRDVLRHQLDGELADPRIVAALAQLDQIEASTRDAQVPDGGRDFYAAKTNRLAHVRDVTKPALHALKFRDVTDLNVEISRLFKALPGIE